MKLIKIIFILLFGLIFFINICHSQKIDSIVINSDSILWSDEEIYQMTKNFSYQDSLYTNTNELKKGHSILKYLPQPDFNIYCEQAMQYYQSVYEIKHYRNDLKTVETIDDWLYLLRKYPGIGKSFTSDTILLGNSTFSNFVTKLRTGEKLIYIRNNSVFFVTNTENNYRQYLHLKRLE